MQYHVSGRVAHPHGGRHRVRGRARRRHVAAAGARRLGGRRRASGGRRLVRREQLRPLTAGTRTTPAGRRTGARPARRGTTMTRKMVDCRSDAQRDRLHPHHRRRGGGTPRRRRRPRRRRARAPRHSGVARAAPRDVRDAEPALADRPDTRGPAGLRRDRWCRLWGRGAGPDGLAALVGPPSDGWPLDSRLSRPDYHCDARSHAGVKTEPGVEPPAGFGRVLGGPCVEPDGRRVSRRGGGRPARAGRRRCARSAPASGRTPRGRRRSPAGRRPRRPAPGPTRTAGPAAPRWRPARRR